MLPEVEIYVKEYREAVNKYNSGHNGWATFAAKKRKAWKDLHEATNNEVIKWMTSRNELVDDFSDHAEAILTALPATLSQLNDLAARLGWCSEWERFRDAAIRDGIVKLDIHLEMRRSGARDWEDFRPLRLRGSNLNKKELAEFVARGVNLITLEVVGGSVYHVREKIVPATS